MSERVLMEHMSWKEIEEAIAGGKTTVILAVGSIEQHGPHMPTGTDAIMGTKLSELTALELGDALVAPTMRPGLAEHHAGFPGTITISPDLFMGLLEEYCENLARHGFKDIVLFSSHGGNTDTITAYLPYIARNLSDQCEVHMLNMPEGHPTEIKQAAQAVFEREGISGPKAGVHAGWAETSQIMAFCPDLVNMDRAAQGQDDPALYRPENIRRFQMESFVFGIKSQSPNGILGDPRGANAKVGAELNRLFAKNAAAEIRRLLKK